LQGAEFDVVKDKLSSIDEVNGVVPVRQEDGIIDLHVACSGRKDMRPVIYEIIKKNDWHLLEFHKETRTLETVFRELTREG
jgi:hypothetical protein